MFSSQNETSEKCPVRGLSVSGARRLPVSVGLPLRGRWVTSSILAGLVSLCLQFSPEQVVAQGRATFTGSNDAEPLVAGFPRTGL